MYRHSTAKKAKKPRAFLTQLQLIGHKNQTPVNQSIKQRYQEAGTANS